MEVNIRNAITVGAAGPDTVALDIKAGVDVAGKSIIGAVYLFLSTTEASELAAALLATSTAVRLEDAQVELPSD